jgi:hypothetical protein
VPKIRVEGVRGSGLSSRAIAWFGGGGVFSHIRSVLPSGDYIDSRSDWTEDGTIPPGVQIRPKDYDTSIVYRVRFEIAVSKKQETQYTEFLHSQIGKPYDKIGIIDFITGNADDRNWRDESAWFCDELVLFGLESIGFPKLLIPDYRVTPNTAGVALTAWGFTHQEIMLTS